MLHAAFTHQHWSAMSSTRLGCRCWYVWELEIVKRSDDVKGFKVLPHRWIVERTFGWLGP